MRANRSTVGGYFLAGRSMTWFPVSTTPKFEDYIIVTFVLDAQAESCIGDNNYVFAYANVHE